MTNRNEVPNQLEWVIHHAERIRKTLGAKKWNDLNGVSEVIKALLPDSPTGRCDFAKVLGLHPRDLEWLAEGLITPLDMNPDVVARIGGLLNISDEDLVRLVEADMRRDPERSELTPMPVAEQDVRLNQLRKEFRNRQRGRCR